MKQPSILRSPWEMSSEYGEYRGEARDQSNRTAATVFVLHAAETTSIPNTTDSP